MFYGGISVGTLQLLEVVTAASPCLRPVFDLSASVEPVNLSKMRVRGAERARLINMLPAPPSHPPEAGCGSDPRPYLSTKPRIEAA